MEFFKEHWLRLISLDDLEGLYCYLSNEGYITLSINRDKHSSKYLLNRAQAAEAAKVLQHYADTGELLNATE